jgi:alkylation response protein AidB-like acyl-CoA dehydrogenase
VNLDETPEEAGFRQEVRRWLDEAIPDELRGATAFEHRLQADRLFAAQGYLAYAWPKEYGGSAGTPIQQAILDEESGRIGIARSRSPSRLGTNLLGPTMMVHGTDDQKRRFLPRILQVQDIWCQGFSEPEAGSDLAGVRTTAVVDGDGLRLSGSKLWTSQATNASWCFVLARTDPDGPRHRNLSMLLVPMDQPGIDARPLKQITGDTGFSQVFFDDVRVPLENVLGGVNNGWAVAMTTVGAERSYGLSSRYGLYAEQLRRAAALIGAADDGPIRDLWLAELGTTYADVTGIRDLAYKLASLGTAGKEETGLTSVTHLWWSHAHQRIVDLGLRVAMETRRDEDYWYRLWLECRAETVYGGSAQIQRNIISERVLGLPRG